MPIEAEMLVPAEQPLLLSIRGAVGHARQPLRLAQSALPVLGRHVHQGRVHALQVVHRRAGLAAEQVPQPVADATVVVIVDGDWNMCFGFSFLEKCTDLLADCCCGDVITTD